jgi:hypothetical protein
MAIDFLAPFGEDLAIGPRPDLSVIGGTIQDFEFVTDVPEIVQRIIRRLLTYQGEWIPFPNYGASLRQYVDAALSLQLVQTIKSVVTKQVMQEPDISPIPTPVVDVQAIPNGIFVAIKVFTRTMQPVSFAFNPADPGTIVGA